jgi:hypothetical protein
LLADRIIFFFFFSRQVRNRFHSDGIKGSSGSEGSQSKATFFEVFITDSFRKDLDRRFIRNVNEYSESRSYHIDLHCMPLVSFITYLVILSQKKDSTI